MIETTKRDGVNPSPPRLRVLILEDDPLDAKLTASVLEAVGYAVQSEVTDSMEVFRERLEKAEYDVILADYNLRNWTAIDALQTLKRSEKDVPLIVVTGSLGDEAAVECIKQGAADFVLKDRLARLPTAVQHALEEKRLRAARMLAEEALQNEKAFTQSIIDGLPDGFYVIDSSGRFVRWNNNAGKTLGYTSEEFAALDPFANVAEDERPLAARKMQEARAKGSATTEVHLLAKDGRKIPYILTATRSVIGGQVYLVGIAVDITERKRAEEALRESEKKYRQLHESMMDGFVRLSLDGKIMEVNDAFCHLLGYTAEELLQATHNDVTPEKWYDFEGDIISGEVLTRGYSNVYAKELRRKDGMIIPVEVRAHLMLDESGNPSGLWAIVRDITERKRSEEARCESEERFRLFMNNSPATAWMKDAQGRYVYLSATYERRHGIRLEDCRGKTDFELWPRAIAEQYCENDQAALAAGHPIEVTEDSLSPDGEHQFWLSYKFPFQDASGQVFVAGSGVDITERIRVEDALVEERRLLHTLMDNLPDLIYFKDRDSHFTRINLALAGQYGLSHPAHADGKSDFDFYNTDQAKEFKRDEEEIIRTGQPMVDKEEKEIWPDGHVTWFSTTKMPLRDPNGDIIGTFGVSRDITERKRAEEALQEGERKYRRLHESMRDGFVRIELDGRITETNDAFGKILGYTAEELLNLPYKNLIPEKWHVVEKCVDEEQVLARGYSRIYFIEYQRKDRVVIPMEVRKHLILDESGNPYGMWAIVRDITERKWAEEMLREYEKVVEGSDEMIAVVDREYSYLLANHAFGEKRGLEREDIVGSTVPEVLGEEFFTKVVKEKLEECFRGNIVQFEAKYPYPKLGERDIHVSYFPIEGTRGVDRAAIVMRDITEHKQAEAQIRESEERFRTAFMTGADAFYIATLNEGVILEVNDCFQEVFGYSREEVIGKTSLQLGLYADPADRARMVSELKSKGSVRNLEISARRRGGELFPLLMSVNLLQENGGQIVLGVLRDITERERAERALIESEERYRTLFENAPVGIYRTTPEGRIVAVNPALAKMLGYSSVTKLIGRDLNAGDFQPQYPRSHFMALMEERGEVTGLESTWRKEDGGTVYVRENARAIRDDSGKILYYEGTVEDITENKQAEAEHLRLVTAIEQSAEAVVITDTAGTIEYVNPAFTRITGYSREEALGKNPRILKSGKHEPALYQQLWATVLKGEIWHGEIINRRKDGSLYTEQMDIAPIRCERGDITHFIATKEDVTVRKQLELQLVQAQKMEAVGRLAGGVAHDFNNLLTIINGYAQLLAEQISPQDPRLDQLNEIMKAGERAASLTRQLLAFSRRQVLEPKVLDLNIVLADLQKMLRRLIGEDIELVTTLKPKLGRVKVDPGQIEQVIMNLAVNARDAMPEGGKLYIETSDVEIDENYAQSHSNMIPGKYVMLAVTDTGIGMDADTQARIFEPFFTTKGKGQGTGLGLAMVYGIVKQSGGFIWVYSEPGQGATFKIYFPAVGEDALAAVPARASAKPANGSETILVVEDEDGVRGLVCHTLRARGYHVLEAQGAEQALKLSEQHGKPIHLLLTDVVMPQTGGKELAKSLSALHPETKVLYMSGYTDDAIVRRGILEQGAAFLQKPFAPDALVRKVREVLRGKPGTQF
jgi:PAS domain S-box-containing protein